MSANVDARGGIPDAVKWAVAIVLVAGGVAGFYVYAEYSVFYRTVGLLVACGIAVFAGSQTEKGRELFGFMRDARNEVRKVVWPTRTETLQTTGIVIVFVFILAIILWILDTLLGWAIKQVLGL
ncbi:MAG: preprotein translocase subunit SecE [Gammaproteobacteria bacterium]|nr:preprotein translocase subunit SecE [Gammaproteobacteria bacterium]